MDVVHRIADLQAALKGVRPAFVPTMGALHDGHLALIRRAGEFQRPVAVSIFVNPAQFGPGEDFTRYPRPLERDLELCRQTGAAVVFAPGVEEMYPLGMEQVAGGFAMPPLPAVATQPQLEDAHRPSHFAGVCKAVARLFDIVQPSHAVFGEKDCQQLRVITEMAHEQQSRWPELRIIAHPTVREPDGLAMSSRNAYLQPSQRGQALGLWRAMNEGQLLGIAVAEPAMREVLHEHGLQIDYAVVRDGRTLLPLELSDRHARCLIAARLGNVRLIDNMRLM